MDNIQNEFDEHNSDMETYTLNLKNIIVTWTTYKMNLTNITVT